MRARDEAVTEVIGYVLSFAISAIFLLIALNVFYQARANTEEVLTGVELKSIADKVASHIVAAGLVGQEFPNATLQERFDIPKDLNGRGYNVTGTSTEVKVATVDGGLSATATTLKLDASGITVSGTVYSSQERITVTYRLNGAARQITIT